MSAGASRSRFSVCPYRPQPFPQIGRGPTCGCRSRGNCIFHQIFFGTEVTDGVIDQLIDNTTEQHAVTAIFHALEQLVDQLDQPAVLFIVNCQAGVETIVPLSGELAAGVG